jgi:tRNA(Ile2) C34 agmatinyltransferase TiaS
VKLEAIRVLDTIRGLAYQRNGICGTCQKAAWVSRSSGHHPWRCPECIEKRLERRKPV